MTLITATIQLSLTLLVGSVQCILTRGPKNVNTVKGSTVVLPCSTSLSRPVLWLYEGTGADKSCGFVLEEKASKHKPRYNLISDASNGQYNLTIRDVQLQDAGTYRCVDDEGFGYDLFLEGFSNYLATAELNVTDNEGAANNNCTLSIEHETNLSGLTVVGDEIFVVRSLQPQVNVYDSHSLTASRDINIPDMKSPSSIVGCAYNKALYISDTVLACIHRVDLTNNSVTRWEMKKIHWPSQLSVTAEGTLLVTIWIGKISGTQLVFGSETGVLEYTSDGQQVREIIFNSSIHCVHQALKLSRDLFIVFHGHCTSRLRVELINTVSSTGTALCNSESS